MKKKLFKKKKDKIDYTPISTLPDKINEYETVLVDIHCSLNDSIGDLSEYLMLQQKLDDLTTNFYSDKRCYEEIFEDIQRRFKRYGAILRNNALLAICALFIPYVGFLIGLTLESFNLIYLRKVNGILKDIEDYSDQVETKFNIIKKNIEIRYDSLNKKLKEYADKKDEVESYSSDDYTFYYASMILGSFLDGCELSVDDLEPNISLALKCILRQDLRCDSDDLRELLERAKKEMEKVNKPKVKHL